MQGPTLLVGLARQSSKLSQKSIPTRIKKVSLEQMFSGIKVIIGQFGDSMVWGILNAKTYPVAASDRLHPHCTCDRPYKCCAAITFSLNCNPDLDPDWNLSHTLLLTCTAALQILHTQVLTKIESTEAINTIKKRGVAN